MMVELSLIAKATLILAVALLATRAAHRARASVRSLILAIAFGLVLVLPIASAIAPAREVTIPEAYATRFLIEEQVAERVAERTAPLTHAARPSSPGWQVPSPRALLWTMWLAGAIVTLLPLALGLWRLREIRRRARAWAEGGELVDALRQSVPLQRSVAVVVHGALDTPMTCGWTQPMIAMPVDAPGWPAADVRQALLHELEHVRRHDWPVHVLARLTCSLYWFHPAAWIAWRQLSLESERACDDAVVLHAENTAYAEQLVSLARRLSRGGAVPLLSMADHRTLSRRVAAILSTTAARGRAGAAAAALVLTGAAALALAIVPVKAIGAQSRGGQTTQVSPNGSAFEVVSIRRNTSSPPGQTITLRGNTFVAQNVTVRELLMTAFDLQADQVSGGPGWIDSERYDVYGRPSGEAPWQQQLLMVQRLLADRFELSVRRETRQAPAYALVVSKNGPKLKVAAVCTNSSPESRCGGFATRPGSFVGRSVSVAQVAILLSGRSSRPVVNKTALEGLFDVELTWTPDASQLPRGPAPDGAPPFDPSGPSLFTALDEQLGLKLEPTTAPKEHLIIERIERPTPNDAPELQVETPRVTPQPAAQSVRQVLSFEVASVKPNVSNSSSSSSDDTPGGYTAINIPLRRLIAFAYRIQPPLDRNQVVAPSWIEGARFDIIARAPAGTLRSQIPDMLRALLIERFKLVAHTETREESVYALVRARSDGQTGPQLTPSSLDCSKPDSGLSGGASANAPGAAFASETPRCGMISVVDAGGSVLRGGGRSMTELARNLTGRVNRSVVDRTGLSGIYDFILRWTPDNFQAIAADAGPSRDGTTIFTAVQEQLGLKLESQRAPIEFLIIDNVERPTPN